MKLVVVANEEECLGFSLAGVEGMVIEDEGMFVEKMQQLFSDTDVGVVAVTDRYFSVFAEHFSSRIEKQPIPAVVFIPSMDGTHHESS